MRRPILIAFLALAGGFLLSTPARAGEYTVLQCPGGTLPADGESRPLGSGNGTSKFACSSGSFLTSATGTGSKNNGRTLSFAAPGGSVITGFETFYSVGSETKWVPEYLAYVDGKVVQRVTLARGESRKFSRATTSGFDKIEFRYTCNDDQCSKAKAFFRVGTGLKITLKDSTAPAIVGTASMIPKAERAWTLYEIASVLDSSSAPVGACLQNPLISTCPKKSDGPRLVVVRGSKYAAIRGGKTGLEIWGQSAISDTGSGIAAVSELVNLKTAATDFSANCPTTTTLLYKGPFPYRLTPCEKSEVVKAVSNDTSPGQGNWREGANAFAIAAADFCNVTDCAPNVSAIGASVIIDRTAPKTGKPVCAGTAGENGWFQGPVGPNCEITASDDNPLAKPQPFYVAGVRQLGWYRNRGATCTDSDKPCVSANPLKVSITEEGINTIRVRPVDYLGNQSDFVARQVKYDPVAPSIDTAAWPADGQALTGTVRFEQRVSDQTAKVSEAAIELRQNEGPWQTLNLRRWKNPVSSSRYAFFLNTARFLPGYGYQVRIRVSDEAGNEATGAETNFEIVPGPPTPTALKVTPSRKNVSRGGKITFRYRSTNGTTDTLRVYANGRRVARLSVGQTTKSWRWRARKAGRVKFVFRPTNGSAQTIRIRVKR